MGCSNIWARFNWTEKNQKVVELNNNLDEEKIEKTPEGKILDKLNLHKICCRRHMLTHVDIE